VTSDVVTRFYTDDETKLAWDTVGREEARALIDLHVALTKETGRVSDETYLVEVKKLREAKGERWRHLLEVLRRRYPGREPPTSPASIEWLSYIPIRFESQIGRLNVYDPLPSVVTQELVGDDVVERSAETTQTLKVAPGVGLAEVSSRSDLTIYPILPRTELRSRSGRGEPKVA
jgi:hypothetical protein